MFGGRFLSLPGIEQHADPGILEGGGGGRVLEKAGP